MKIKHDGRIVYDKQREYARFRKRIHDYQDELCYRCGHWCDFDMFQVHHQGERGLSGSRRNDKPWFEVHQDKQPMVDGLCYGICVGCHREVDKKRLHWSKSKPQEAVSLS
jgi:hypothetical protein